MRLTWNDTELEFQASIARTLDDAHVLDHVRALMNEKRPDGDHLSDKLVELGVTEAAIPEQNGGLGLGYEPICLAAFELGKRLSPFSFASTLGIGLTASLLLEDDCLANQFRALKTRCAGARLAHLGSTSLSFEKKEVCGEVSFAWDTHNADVVLVATTDRSGSPILALIELGNAGVTHTPLPSIDPTRSTAKLSFKKAPSTLLASGDRAVTYAETLMQHVDLYVAFEQIGGAISALEMACNYARERTAFGQPIGAFQAIKHRLADIYTKNEIARAHARYAADCLSHGESDTGIAVACARAAANEAFLFAAKESLHIHGGIGFTFDSDCHLFYRRARFLSAIGTPQLETLEAVASHVVTTAEGATA